MKKKKQNFEIKLICKELKLEEIRTFHSPEIEKIIKTNTKIKKKATINDCDSDVILDIYECWESKKLTVPGTNGIEALANFIHNTYKILKKNESDVFLTLAAIKSRLYKIRG